MKPVTISQGKYYKLVVLVAVVLPFIGVFAAIGLLWNSYVFAMDIILLATLTVMVALGVTIGYHRMLTHQSFQTIAPIKALLLILGCMSFEGGPASWAATHTYHHAHSDEEGDPHSPLDGFWHAHFGWLFRTEMEDPRVYVPHLVADPVIMFVQRSAIFWMGLSLLIPFLIGGWTGLIWGGFVRLFYTMHVTWSVNSVCHTFGRREFETSDESRNEWVVGLLAFGEGWHNNHHAFPRNAFHGMRWWQFDLSGLIIRVLEKLGLAWDVQRVSDEVAEAQKIRAQNAQGGIATLRDQLMQKIEHAQEAFLSLQITQAEESVENAARRLLEIRIAVERASHLKKQKLQIYLSEVESLKNRFMMMPINGKESSRVI